MVGVGDRIVTRRNDPDLDVANRDTWFVAAVGSRGGRLVTPDDVPPAGGVRASVTPASGRRVLPADYVTAHVELAYASTAHGAQGARRLPRMWWSESTPGRGRPTWG